MKAEDTVMMEIQIESVLKPLFPIDDCSKCEKAIVEAQAEISFKAGIKEVVGFYNCMGFAQVDSSYVKGKLKAKLKEWGIQ